MRRYASIQAQMRLSWVSGTWCRSTLRGWYHVQWNGPTRNSPGATLIPAEMRHWSRALHRHGMSWPLLSRMGLSQPTFSVLRECCNIYWLCLVLLFLVAVLSKSTAPSRYYFQEKSQIGCTDHLHWMCNQFSSNYCNIDARFVLSANGMIFKLLC